MQSLFYNEKTASTALFKTFQIYEKINVYGVIAVVLTVFNSCKKDELPIDDKVNNELSSKKAFVHVENDYLAVNSFETVDSLLNLLQNKSIEEQKNWEQKTGLKSAKTYRAESSEKLNTFQNVKDAEGFINNLTKEGFFNKVDSTLCYPF